LKLAEKEFEPVHSKLLKRTNGFEDMKDMLGKIKGGLLNMGS
jgi:hypothetical protein